MNTFLFKKIDNSALIIFRIFFGLLIFLESVGAIITGWVKRTLIDPEFTFSFIGFEWLQPLPGNGMYYYFALMGVFSIFVMIGFKYRASMLAFALLWTGVYFMQKASYNNHYYLLMLLSYIMIFVPANNYASVDVKLNPKLTSNTMYNWHKWLLISLMTIAYTFGAINKIYSDWLNAIPLEIFMKSKSHYYVIGNLLQERWVHYLLSYLGIIFDGLIIPLLLFKPTRKIAFYAAIFFHLFNSIVFQIGIFPYLSLAFCLFFFEAETIGNIFLKSKEIYKGNAIVYPKNKVIIKWSLVIFLTIQIALPLRHWAIPGDVLWNEEGHRLSWRMMLRSKNGIISYKVIDKKTRKEKVLNHRTLVSPKQINLLATKPDVIWQFAQYLKKKYKAEGKDIEVYARYSKLSVNGKKLHPFINPDVDLTTVKWEPFKHANWIFDQPDYIDREKQLEKRKNDSDNPIKQ